MQIYATPVAFAQTGSISGSVYHDTAGNATSSGPAFAVPAQLTLFNATGAKITTITADNSGNFTFGSLSNATYYISVDNTDALAGFTDGQGSGVVEQTYASSGDGGTNNSAPICAGAASNYTQRVDYTTAPSNWLGTAQNGGKSGPCYGGRQGDVANVSGTDVLNDKEHVIKIVLGIGANVVTNVKFGFSLNAVTNFNASGEGSLSMFIRAANSRNDAAVMRFVPSVSPNQSSNGANWWRIDLTNATGLPAITAAYTTIDGRAYKNTNGSDILTTNPGNVSAAINVGVTNYAIAAIERPELEILEDLGTNEATLEVQADNVTIQNVAFNSSVNQTGSGYHIRQSAGTNLTVANNVLGYDLATNANATMRSWYGIATAYAASSNSKGAYRHNYVSSNSSALLLSDGSGGAGNVVAATLGDWVLEENILDGGIRLGEGTDRISVRHNYAKESIVLAQGPAANTAVGNSTFTENTITGSNSDNIQLYDSDNNRVTLNLIQNANGAGISIGADGTGNLISQNLFGNNFDNAIDLNNDGVTAATGCTDAGTANGGLGRPAITAAELANNTLTLVGSYCPTGVFDIEIYKVAVSAGEGVPDAGEGVAYLGKISGVSGGGFDNHTLAIPGNVTFNAGDRISALLIDTVTGNTSEFSANYVVYFTIAGKIFQDVLGTASPTGAPFIGSTSADLHLYDTAGTHLQRVYPNANGDFVFTGLTNGTYYVTLNDFRGLATGSVGVGLTAVEQTYASAGDGVTGSGPICVGAAPTYTEQTSSTPTSWTIGAQNGNATNGPCYGGRRRSASTVSNSSTPTIANTDHVIRIVVQNKKVTGVALGFSANVVTRVTGDTNQGSFSTFLSLANALSGPNAMRFVPLLPPTQTSNSGQTWWRISYAFALPALTDAGTTIDGTAYNNIDGVTVRDTNSVTLGVTSAVGTGADGRSTTGDEPTMTGVAAPELELIPGTTLDYGLDIAANDTTVQKLAIYGYGDTAPPFPTGANTYGETGNLIIRNGAANITIKDTILGAPANSFTDPGSSARTKGSNLIFDAGANNVTIEHNLIGFASDTGILKYGENGAGALTNLAIHNNEIRDNGKAPAVNTQGAGIELNNTALPATSQLIAITQNLITANAAQAIQLNDSRGVAITSNNLSNNGVGSNVSVNERQNLQLGGGQDIQIERNNLNNNAVSDGIELRAGTTGSAATHIRISQNQFGASGGQAINLIPDGVNQNNGNCNEAGQQNTGVDTPVITLAELTTGGLTVHGSSCTGVAGTIEIYKVAAGSGPGESVGNNVYGEGGIYLGSFAVSGGVFSGQTIVDFDGLKAGEAVTALLIDNNGNTSEFSSNAYVFTPVTLAATTAIREGATGAITATIGYTSVNDVNITLVFTNITTSGNDYTASTTVVIPAGQLSARVLFTILDDQLVENPESFQVGIGSVQNARNVSTVQTVNITDNDIAIVTLVATPLLVEGATSKITVTLNLLSVNQVQATLVYTNTSASGADYTGPATIIIPAGQTSASVLLTAINDNITEGDENFEIGISSVQNAINASTPKTITILNDEDDDGRADNIDNDDDGDGVPDALEGNGGLNTDGDDVPDTLDPDSDNDGILDRNEAHDRNGDGKADVIPAGADTDKDGLDNAFDTDNGGTAPALIDTDGDSKPNYQDADDDGDAKETKSEDDNLDSDGNPSTAPADHDGDQLVDWLDPDDSATDGSGGDSDNDGVMDRDEANVNGDALLPDDTDQDGKADYLDTDDDGDGVPTTTELPDPNSDGSVADAQNTDRDNKPDYLDTDDDGDNKSTKTEDANGDNDSNPATTPTDRDADRIPDYLDPNDGTANGSGGDSDGDGVNDKSEFDANGDNAGPDDTDFDGIDNYLDNDDDNDGIPTNQENADPNGDGYPTDALDSEGDNIPDYLDNDTDNDGLNDRIEFDINGDGFGPDDSDNDGAPNKLDADDDNDGIPTIQENADPNGDADPADAVDTDQDDAPDFLDKDDDNDGILTKTEDLNTDGDGNPATNPTDRDGDTIRDYLDRDTGTTNGTGGDSDGDSLNDVSELDANQDNNRPDDTDGDGLADYLDNDDDNDGILTNQEQPDPNGDSSPADARDTDGDGKPDYRDSNNQDGPLGDPDGDGVGNSTEDLNHNGNYNDDDTDGDHTPNYLDNNDDNDALPTASEDVNGDGNRTNDDSDGDGKPNYLDANDNDGPLGNLDGDSLNNSAEDTNHDGNYNNDDGDGDGTPNYLDANDGDGPLGNPDGDALNNTAEDSNQDGNYNNDDADGDGTPNFLDANDNDGPLGNLDGDSLNNGAEDVNHDGNYNNDDSDGDGKPNYLDADDNDGPLGDLDGDTVKNGVEDLNKDGNYNNDDSDGDSKPNAQDADDDNDGVPTIDEDGNGDGNPTNDDADGDGKSDYLDVDTPGDTDGDGLPNSTDTDDDGDGASDVEEGNGAVDTDKDGTPDSLDMDDDGDGISSKAEDLNGDGNRANDDTDKDGKPDALDSDDDNDGLRTKDESPTANQAASANVTADSDGDGLPNHRDLDSDNDGIADVIEAGGADPDSNGIVGSGPLVDADNDGLLDVADPDQGGAALTNVDSDNDGKPNSTDLDSDNDGIFDVVEAGSSDPDNNGMIGTGMPADTDGDGLPDAVDPDQGGKPASFPDSDGDGTPDYLDSGASLFVINLPMIRR